MGNSIITRIEEQAKYVKIDYSNSCILRGCFDVGSHQWSSSSIDEKLEALEKLVNKDGENIQRLAFGMMQGCNNNDVTMKTGDIAQSLSILLNELLKKNKKQLIPGQFENFKEIIKETDYSNVNLEKVDNLNIKEISTTRVVYAPFDYINKDARVVICGITPGKTQAIDALKKASELLKNDESLSNDEILKRTKKIASFSGAMRSNLVIMLNDIGLCELLGINSSEELFDTREDLVHYTSLLRNPVFSADKNYSGKNPEILKNEVLQKELENFKYEVSVLSDNTIYVPLGKAVEKVFKYLIKDKTVKLSESQVLFGFPHPSGGNVSRGKQFKNNQDDLIKQIKSFK